MSLTVQLGLHSQWGPCMRKVSSSLNCHRQMGQLLLAPSQLRVQGSQKAWLQGRWRRPRPVSQLSMQIWQSSQPSAARLCSRPHRGSASGRSCAGHSIS